MNLASIAVLVCLAVFQGGGGPAAPSGSSQEELRKKIESMVRDLNRDTEQRLKALEAQVRTQAGGAATGAEKGEPSFQFTISRGMEKGTAERIVPLAVPLVSVLTVLVTLLMNIWLQRKTHAHQVTLQGMNEKHQQRLQEIGAKNDSELQRTERLEARQLEAAQDVWAFLEQTGETYQLDNPNTRLGDSISVIAFPDRSQSQREIRDLLRKHGFFLPRGSEAILAEVQKELREANVALRTFKEKLGNIREMIRAEFTTRK